MKPSKDFKIFELIDKYDSGKLRLPELQRGYVWTENQVSDFFYSLYRGHPTGTILTWENDGNDGIRTRSSEIGQGNSAQTELLLDGQQRLTSLVAFLKGKFFVSRKNKNIDILFNLRHPDPKKIYEDAEDADKAKSAKDYDKMFFAPSKKELVEKPQYRYWISVSKFFKSLNKGIDIDSFLKDEEFDRNDPQYTSYCERLEKLEDIKNYEYRVITLEKGTPYPEVGEIFVRVNSAGTKLKGSDLALAQITVKWSGALKEFEEFMEECKGQGFDFDIGTHVRNLVVFATGQCKFKNITHITQKEWEDSWNKAKDDMRFALNFLKDNVKIDSYSKTNNSSLLSSPYLAISTVYYRHKKGHELGDEEKLKRWILLANMHGRYSWGSSEGFLDKDLSLIKSELDSALDDLIGDLARSAKLYIESTDLKGVGKNSTFFKTIRMAFRDAGAKDWFSKTEFGPNNKGKQKLEAHHIFPKKIFEGLSYKDKQINDIANLAFITSETNKKLGGKPPTEYIKMIPNYENLFAKQCIPTDKNLLELHNYEEFLEARRQLIADRLNKFLGNEES